MIDGLRLELKDVEPIVSADIDINRINVIGGKNATGKSTASKLLYSFLKVNSSDREKLVASTINKSVSELYQHFRVISRNDRSLLQLTHNLRKMRMMLNRQSYDDFEEVIELFDEIEPDMYEFLETHRYVYETDRREPGVRLFSRNEKLLAELKKVRRILNSIEEDSYDFFKEVMRDVLSSEFDIDFSSDPESDQSPDYRINFAKLHDPSNADFSFEIKLNDVGKELESEGEFYVSNVFYL